MLPSIPEPPTLILTVFNSKLRWIKRDKPDFRESTSIVASHAWGTCNILTNGSTYTIPEVETNERAKWGNPDRIWHTLC